MMFFTVVSLWKFAEKTILTIKTSKEYEYL